MRSEAESKPGKINLIHVHEGHKNNRLSKLLPYSLQNRANMKLHFAVLIFCCIAFIDKAASFVSLQTQPHTTGLLASKTVDEVLPTNDIALQGTAQAAHVRLADHVSAVKHIFKEACKFKTVPHFLEERAEQCLTNLCSNMETYLGPLSSLSKADKDRIGVWIQRELFPYFDCGMLSHRILSKPLGYAGDYLTIDTIYDNKPGAQRENGELADKLFLAHPCARAVQNRSQWMRSEIMHTVSECSEELGRPAYILSLACGPAREITDILVESRNATMEAFLLDFEESALNHVAARLVEQQIDNKKATLIKGDLLKLAKGKEHIQLPCPPDLVYSMGLIDYFSDKFVVRLFDLIYDILQPGGRVILGNFRSPSKFSQWMEYLLDWKLTYRHELDMDSLFLQSKFGMPATKISVDDTGIQLFAECRK